MKKFCLFFAYFLIWTTPIQLAFLFWILWVVLSSDYTILSLSMANFLEIHLSWLKDWVYSWFWNDWLDFWWAFPALILGFLKLAINTWLGFWLLPIAKKMQ